jgi:hypothetical protein
MERNARLGKWYYDRSAVSLSEVQRVKTFRASRDMLRIDVQGSKAKIVLERSTRYARSGVSLPSPHIVAKI